ncbi:MAG: hypothetical protein K8T25_11535 [Planctomycetia bacterium]|nr:hypothetical protein [Planctomycetia bacterium]
MSEYWEKTVQQNASLQQRLANLSTIQVVSFATGCAQHVADAFTALYSVRKIDAKSIAPFTDMWTIGLVTCWTAVAGMDATEAAERSAHWIDELFKDDKILDLAVTIGAFNIDQVTGGVYKALECLIRNGHPEYAKGAAHCAFEAVMQWHAADLAIGEESNSAECVAEVDFQLRYLAALESIEGQIPLYDTMLDIL